MGEVERKGEEGERRRERKGGEGRGGGEGREGEGQVERGRNIGLVHEQRLDETKV